MIRKILIATLFLTMSTTAVDAQELNCWLNGGLQGLSYSLQNGHSNLLFGGSLGLGYTFPLNTNWNLVTGLSGGSFGTRAKLNDGTYSYYAVDNTGSAFRFDVKSTGYKETQRFFSIGIPLMAQYHTTGSSTQFYINGGGKLILPFSANVKASAEQLALSGFYPDFNLEVTNLTQHGFGTINNWQGTTSSKLKAGAALIAETGVSFVLSQSSRLYTGLFLEYGLTDMRSENGSSSLVVYNPNGITPVQPASVLNTQNTGSTKLLSFGITAKLGFGLHHN
jgi:hypothetical protein